MVLAKLVEDKINFLNNKILKDKHLDLTDLKKYETELLTYLSFYPLKDFCTKVPICEVTDSNGETIVRFALYPNGYSKLTIKEGNNPVKVLVETFSITKNHKVENGEIYLSDGEISNRFGFYRDELFLKFLKKNKIRYVRRDNPNKEYVIRQALLETGKIDETIKTDGTLTEINKVEDENLKGTSFYDISTTYRVDNAKWVVVYRSGHSGRLYTQEKNFLDFKIFNTKFSSPH